jgi:hypothetical protein
MNSGILFYNGSKTLTMEEKISEAATYYRKKYGRLPEIAIVNPGDVAKMPPPPPDQMMVEGKWVTVRSWQSIPTGHLWLGFDASPDPEPQKPDSDIVAAFVQHAQKARVE